VRLRPTSIALAALIVAGLSGCTFTAPQTNQQPYDPSDGFGEDIGDLGIRNAILVSEDGETGNLAMDVVNSGSTNAALVLSWEGVAGRAERNIYIPANQTESLGDEANRVILEGIDAVPGSLFPVYIQYGDVEGKEMLVPVLDGELEEYADLVPEPSASDDTGPSPEASGSAEPSPDASGSSEPTSSSSTAPEPDPAGPESGEPDPEVSAG
jgi:hypothetical protein